MAEKPVGLKIMTIKLDWIQKKEEHSSMAAGKAKSRWDNNAFPRPSAGLEGFRHHFSARQITWFSSAFVNLKKVIHTLKGEARA